MLCGHVHVPKISNFTGSDQRRTLDVLEARCGTTTQLDRLPFGWRNFRGRRPDRRLAVNTLLVHRVDEERGDVFWSVEAYQRYEQEFGPAASPRPRRVKVWPRPYAVGAGRPHA